MPTYRNGNDEYRRKPTTNYEKEYEPEEEEEEEDAVEERKPTKKQPYFCKIECPFKVVVKLIPCDDHKRPEPL